MSIRKLPNGRWEARERVGGRGSRRLSQTFDRKRDAERWEARMRRQRQLGAPLEEDDVTLAEFTEEYWRLHAMPNLAPNTRASYRMSGASTSTTGWASASCARSPRRS
jgi:hypothetical protein